MPDYLKYQQRKLREQLSLSPYNQLQSEVRQVGRETQRIAKQTDATLKRQNVPLGARIESARELQTNYAQNIGAAYERVSLQDQQRKQGLISELEAVNIQMAEQKEAEDKSTLNTALQVGGTIVGAAAGFIGTGGNPVGALMGAQYGAAAGQAISGGYNIAKGDASAQDWSNLGQGIISGVSLGVEQANLKSIKAENTRTAQFMTKVFNDQNIPDWQSKWILEQAETRLISGNPIDDIMEMYSGINQGGSNKYELTPSGRILDTISGRRYDDINEIKNLTLEDKTYIQGLF